MKHIIENKHRLDTGSQKLISAESLIIHQLYYAESAKTLQPASLSP